MNFSTKAVLSALSMFGGTARVAAENHPVPNDAICLTQDDFNQGTKTIATPGNYKLCSDITFGPNGPAAGEPPSETAFDPKFSDEYPQNEYGLGFFTALVIAADGVSLYLNGHTIEQSAEHALMQRFFSVIELANSPFIPGVGPAQFVSDGGTAYMSATNVNIFGPGVIGRSSHHGIHGNNNVNVKVEGVEFRDFEVAAVALNKADNLVISDNVVTNNRHDVPIVGMFSAARFIRPYGKYLKSIDYSVKDENGTVWKTAEQTYDALITSINKVYDDVSNHGFIQKDKNPQEFHLFDNPHRAVDGPCYAFLVHGKGPAVGGQGEMFNELDSSTTSSDIVIQDNIVNGIKCWNNEVPALFGKCGGHGCIQNDVRGSVFQTIKSDSMSSDPYLSIDAAGKYIGNVVADMQLIVAQAVIDGTLPNLPAAQIGPNSITQDLIDWARNGGTLTPKYICNGDSMHHVMKGMIMIRVEDTEGFVINGNIISNVENLSPKPYGNCYDYHIGTSNENLNKQQGGNVRSISVAADRAYENQESSIKNNYVCATASANADYVIGIDIQGDSQGIKVTQNKVDLEDVDSILVTSVVENDNEDYAIESLRKSLRADIRDTVPWETDLEAEQDGIKLISLRTREQARDINVFNNHFVQPTQVLDSASARRLHAPHPHMSGQDEWKYGGCPFADDYAEEPAPVV